MVHLLRSVYDFEVVGSERFYATVYRKGAYVGQIFLDGMKILKETKDSMELNGGIPILIPYADLVKNAKYSFNNKEFHLPKNAHVIGNFKDSIHGLVRSQEWQVDERGEDFVSLVTYVDDPGYPSKLMVKVVYRLTYLSFEANISVTNIGQIDAPIVIGAHPYFKVTHLWRLYHHSKIQMLNYPDGIFPDGKLIDYSFNDIEDPGKLNLDHSFIGGGNLKLESGLSTIKIERRNMDYFEVYNGTYAGKDSVAIEPMTGAINAFNNHIGLKILSPDKKMDCGFAITLL